MTTSIESVSPPAHIRWLIRRDLPGVLAIENGSFANPWCENDFIRCLRQRSCIGMVAERNEEVVGFMVYSLETAAIYILNFAVHPDHRRKKIGQTMIDKLKSKLSRMRRNKLYITISESKLPAQLFFKSQRFFATEVLRNHFEDSDESAYLFEHDFHPENDIGSESHCDSDVYSS